MDMATREIFITTCAVICVIATVSTLFIYAGRESEAEKLRLYNETLEKRIASLRTEIYILKDAGYGECKLRVIDGGRVDESKE